MKIKNIAVKFFAAAMFVSYVGSASAAFTGGSTILVNGSTTISGGANSINTGVDFDETSFPLVSDLEPGMPRLSSSAGEVDFGFSNPFLDFNIADPAGTTLLSTSDFFGNTVLELSLIEVVDILPVSGDSTNGAVDYAGLGNLTINGLEQTEVFWQYNVGGGSVGINIDAAGRQNATYISIINAQASAIPVPAAVWLFGSALVGLFGLSRKKVS